MDRRHFVSSLVAGAGVMLSRSAPAQVAEVLSDLPEAAAAAGPPKRILFDSRGAQVQVNRQTGGRRLNSFLGMLSNFPIDPSTGNSASPYRYSFSYLRMPLTPQLEATRANVLVILTHQRSPQLSNQLDPPAFRYTQEDLDGIPAWVAGGGGLLLISNHGAFKTRTDPRPPPYWTINDAKLARRFGITIVPAAFATGLPRSPRPAVCTSGEHPLVMTPAPTAPRGLIRGVTRLSVWDGCGISAPNGRVVFKFPADCVDMSGRDYQPDDYCFCLTLSWGLGKVVVLSHSGIVGDLCTPEPSWGQISAAGNLRFLSNALSYLSGAA